MAKNKLTVSIAISDRRSMPAGPVAEEWFARQYREAVELAEKSRDGTLRVVRSDYPVETEE